MTGSGVAGIRFLSAYFHVGRTHPPSFPRKRESSASVWIPGLRFAPPGMTGERGGWYPVSVSAFSRPSNPPTVIPAKAGIHYLGMDSGSPFHSTRNDGGAGWLVSGFCQCLSTSVEPTHRHSRESGNPLPRHMDSGSPFHSARNDGGSGVAGIQSLSEYFHARRPNPPSFPRKRESTTSAWIPGLRSTPPRMTEVGRLVPGFCQCISPPVEPTHSHSRESGNPIPRHGFPVGHFTPPGMTRNGQPCRTRPTPFASTSSGFPRSFSPADPFRRGRGWGR